MHPLLSQRMTPVLPLLPAVFLACLISAGVSSALADDVRAWEGTLTLPTYAWQEDINPKFWALEGGAKLSTTIQGAITYPYVMQDHLLREKADRTYQALFLENEYLKVTCLPELGGRLHSVYDKASGQETFHTSSVIKPGMIAMRGAWISGGVEWNTGPHGHTVTIVSPVNATTGRDDDGSAWLEISNLEQIFRTRWTVRVTLRPGRAYLEERIRIENPTDGMHPYYFWNCTAFPNRPGTRFIYPMTLGTDHNAREFFRWPVDKGRDLTWLKNYETYASVFAVTCTYDFFGAYDVDADRGIVQYANHRELGGKKAWTWGEWEFGKVAQKNLTDSDGPYIEVQSGPLPTQSDYGMLGPHEHVAWQEWWYPVRGLGDGFEYATRDVAVQSARRDGRLELRIVATGRFPDALCTLSRHGDELRQQRVALAPAAPAVVTLDGAGDEPVNVWLLSRDARDAEILAHFTTPLPIPKVDPPDPAKFAEKPDAERSVEELYLEGRKADRGTERKKAREYYEKALARDPGHVASLRVLAVLDFEAALYDKAAEQLEKALARDSDDGLAWYYLGASRLRQGKLAEAIDCGYRAVRCPGTAALGYDLAARAAAQQADPETAVTLLEKAMRAGGDVLAGDHLVVALYAANRRDDARRWADRRVGAAPTTLVGRTVLALLDGKLDALAREARATLGEDDFEILEASLTLAEMGLYHEASQLLEAACVEAVPEGERSFLPMYYLAWYARQQGLNDFALRWRDRAEATHKDRVFASRPEELEILRYAASGRAPRDAQAHLQLGCLLANLGRVDEAVTAWRAAADADPRQSIAWRNLGLAAAAADKLADAEEFYRKAIAARPGDQTLYRDLAEILLADDKRDEAIRVMEQMPVEGLRRADITVMLATAYNEVERWDDTVKLLESTPYFVNWEGQDVTWRLFNRAHVERGRQRLERGETAAALADFEAALTYPANLNVGRSNKPEEAPAQYWRGKTLAAMGRMDEAKAAWRAGADGADVRGEQNEYRQKCREELGG